MRGAQLLRTRVPVLAAALWWGSLTTIGFLAVPLLFAHLPSPSLAGFMAAKLFAAQTWVTVACCVVLLTLSKPKSALSLEPWAQAAIVFILGGLLLALLVQYGVAPRIVARQNLQLWHSAGTVMYAAQWLCALVVLWHTAAGGRAPQPSADLAEQAID